MRYIRNRHWNGGLINVGGNATKTLYNSTNRKII